MRPKLPLNTLRLTEKQFGAAPFRCIAARSREMPGCQTIEELDMKFKQATPSAIAAALLVGALQTAPVFATESSALTDDKDQCFIGSSAFMLANLTPDSPSYYQLDFGYKLNPKESVLLHAITWKYDAPLGIPYGASFGAEAEKYPGSVKAYGIGAGYQHYLTEHVFTSLHATAFRQHYRDKNNREIQQGYQLFLQAKLGYHMELFDKQYYLEPAVSFNHWPVNTNLPASFAKQEQKWPSYFLFEPSLNFGMNF